MKILALELSSGEGSIAWIDAGQDLLVRSFANDRKHSGLFFQNLKACLEQFGNPGRIVVGLGPGSYAGTRIAISTAIGLQAATGAELLGLPSPCGMPTAALAYAVIGDARRESFFFAEVCERRCVEGPKLFTQAELAEQLKGMSSPIFSAESLVAFPQAAIAHPSALILARIATESADLVRAPLEPIYLREPHITRAKTVTA